MVTAVREPSRFATVRVVPHSVAVGQQRALTVKVQMTPAAVGTFIAAAVFALPPLAWAVAMR